MNIKDYKIKANFEAENYKIMEESDAAADDFFKTIDMLNSGENADVNMFYDAFINYANKTNLHLETFLDYLKYWYEKYECYEKLFEKDQVALAKIQKMLSSGEEIFDTYSYMCQKLNEVRDALKNAINKVKNPDLPDENLDKDEFLDAQVDVLGNLYLDLVEQANDFAHNVGGSYIDTCWAVYTADLDVDKTVNELIQTNTMTEDENTRI